VLRALHPSFYKLCNFFNNDDDNINLFTHPFGSGLILSYTLFMCDADAFFYTPTYPVPVYLGASTALGEYGEVHGACACLGTLSTPPPSPLPPSRVRHQPSAAPTPRAIVVCAPPLPLW
jgi:hypothetical protein